MRLTIEITVMDDIYATANKECIQAGIPAGTPVIVRQALPHINGTGIHYLIWTGIACRKAKIYHAC